MDNKQAKSAGKLGLITLIAGIAILFSSASGAEYFTGPSLIILSLVCGRFWYKGTYGDKADQEWVESNF